MMWKFWLKFVLLFALYLGSARIGLSVFPTNGFAAIFWPSSGIALAFLFLWGNRFWPAVFLGSFIASLWHGGSWQLAACIGAGGTLEPILGAFLLKKVGFHPALDRVKDVLVITFLAGLLSAIVSSTIGVFSLLIFQFIAPDDLFLTWQSWWLGDFLGDLKFASLIFVWSSKPKVFTNKHKIIEAIALLVTIIAVCVFVFGLSQNYRSYKPLPFFFYPVLIWATLRFRSCGAISMTVLVSVIAILATVENFGPFIEQTPFLSLLSLQVFVALLTFTTLILAAVVQENALALESLKKASEAALQSAVLTSRFLANTSHEIRTPLNGILGTVELLALTSLTNTQKEYVNTIETSGRTLLTILDDIIDFSLIESGKLTISEEAFDLRARICQMIRLLTPQAQKKNLQLTYSIEESVPTYVKSDPNLIEQILMNLVNNAIKYTNQGKVELTVKKLEERGMILFEVHDTGIGISSENQLSLFTPFTQVKLPMKKKYSGVGLGLAICKSLVQKLGGEIGVKSAPEKGSTFWFALPLHSALSIVQESALLPPIQKATILVAEDDEVNQKVILLQLEHLGYTAEIAVDGYDVLEKLKHKSYDLILMDCLMPNMDGLTAAVEIRKREGAHHTPIIAMTAYAMKNDRDMAIHAGMDDYLSKPVQLADLQSMIPKYLQTPPAHTELLSSAAAPVDLDSLRRLVKGDEQALSTMLHLLAAQMEEYIKNLSRAAPSERDAIVEKCIESSETMGSHALTTLLREYQVSQHENRLDEWPSLLKAIDKELQIIKEYVQRHS